MVFEKKNHRKGGSKITILSGRKRETRIVHKEEKERSIEKQADEQAGVLSKGLVEEGVLGRRWWSPMTNAE